MVIRLALFVGLPIVELFLLAALEDRFGLAPTLLLILLTGVIGARVVGRQGRAVWWAIRARLAAGEIPQAELAHGAMLLVAGALLVTPGVLTDAFGASLLVPWFRELLRVRFFRTMRVVAW
jgi:UPF0716 protein FxsA